MRASLTTSEALALGYLGLPVVIFTAVWFVPWAAAIGVGAACVLFAAALPARPAPSRNVNTSFSKGLICLGVAALWCSFGGAGHLWYANEMDWIGRDAILRDLVLSRWPVQVTDGAGVWWYRAPLAHYVLPAALAKVTGLWSADTLLYAYTVLGVSLVLRLSIREHWTSPMVVAVCTVVVLFSGADAVGEALLGTPALLLDSRHLEWWASTYQFSSNTTLLFWVPAHALPGWLMAAWIWRRWDDPNALRWAVVWPALGCLWSPLASLGGALLILCNAFVWWARDPRLTAKALASLPNAAALPLGIMLALYLTASAHTIPQATALAMHTARSLISAEFHSIGFWLLECGLLLLLVLSRKRAAMLASVSLVLVACLSYRFGLSNDWAMRGSVAPLMLLCLCCSERLFERVPSAAVARAKTLARWRKVALTVVLLLGVITPLHEVVRAVTLPSWKPDFERSLVQVAGGAANYPHYFVEIGDKRLSWLLRKH